MAHLGQVEVKPRVLSKLPARIRLPEFTSLASRRNGSGGGGLGSSAKDQEFAVDGVSDKAGVLAAITGVETVAFMP